MQPREGLRARFYEHYRKEAEEYDREFLRNHDEDLNTTLIFVSYAHLSDTRLLSWTQAGLFSAVTAVFIIQVHSGLQPDPTGGAAALLRVLLHKMDNTTFGGDIPSIPQWTGPPRTIVHVQAILYTSLAASLFSAFLAMLGKQWLNRYASIDMRGTTIERSQDRQRKLDGVVTWYFDYAMESLPLMLQVALLLLGCALSRYLWEIDVTVACIALGATALGVIFYIFVVVAGTVSASCPYQAPAARILRLTLPRIIGIFHSTLYILLDGSLCISLFPDVQGNWRNWKGSVSKLLKYVPFFPVFLFYDTWQFFVLTARVLIVLSGTPIIFFRRVYNARSVRTHGPNQRTDLECISWMLQTSLETNIRMLALKFLATAPISTHFNPVLVSDCFDILTDCIKVNNSNVVTTQGLEELAEVSIVCFFRTYSHLSIVDPTSSVLADTRQRYRMTFPSGLDLSGFPFPHALGIAHEAFYPRWGAHTPIEWKDYRPGGYEHVTVAHALAKFSLSRYQWKRPYGVPHLCRGFAVHFLTQAPPPPRSIVANCLLIMAIDLDCDVPDIMVLEERYDPTWRIFTTMLIRSRTQPKEISDLIIQKFDAMTESHRRPAPWLKPEVVDPLFWYAVQLERLGDTSLFDAIIHFAKEEIITYGSHTPSLRRLKVSDVFIYASPRAAVLAAPHIQWEQGTPIDVRSLISKWVAAVSAVPYTEEIAQDVVDVLLQVAANSSARPYIPAGIWLWLYKRPSLSPCRGLLLGDMPGVVRAVRALNDIGMLTSYLVLVWSHWKVPDFQDEMHALIREDFNGIGMGCHRGELLQRLDFILGELDRRSRRLDVDLEEDRLWRDKVGRQSKVMKERYGEFKRILQEVEQEATEILDRMRFQLGVSQSLIFTNLYRNAFHLHVRSASPIPIASSFECSAL